MKENNWYTVLAALLVVALIMTGFNAYQLSTMKDMQIPAAVTTPTAATQQLAGPDIIPKGTPTIYGAELGIKYDDVSADNPQLADATIRKLAQYDVDIQLNEEQKARYINILYKMENGVACEYCCGARSVIFENGDPACGCAHSYSMRGLTKYLITKHGSEYTDAQILEEVGKWKTLYFPGILTQKAAVLQANGIELNYINIASNKYRGAEKQAQGGSGGGQMVGGC